jgi:hypothetical protein
MRVKAFLCEHDKSEMTLKEYKNISVLGDVTHFSAYTCQTPGCSVRYEPFLIGWFLMDSEDRIQAFPTTHPRCGSNGHTPLGIARIDGKLKWVCPEEACTFAKDY